MAATAAAGSTPTSAGRPAPPSPRWPGLWPGTADGKRHPLAVERSRGRPGRRVRRRSQPGSAGDGRGRSRARPAPVAVGRERIGRRTRGRRRRRPSTVEPAATQSCGPAAAAQATSGSSALATTWSRGGARRPPATTSANVRTSPMRSSWSRLRFSSDDDRGLPGVDGHGAASARRPRARPGRGATRSDSGGDQPGACWRRCAVADHRPRACRAAAASERGWWSSCRWCR